MKSLIITLAVSAVVAANAAAQSPADRAAELKNWTKQCSDPDADLRLAYIENAIATDDVTVQRRCIGLALESDDEDVRNLGLRAAIASLDQITFEAQMPTIVSDELAEADDDEDRLDEVKRRWNSTLYVYKYFKSGVIFEIDKSLVSEANSKWYAMVDLRKRQDDHRGDAQIIGSQLTWSGAIDEAGNCVLKANLDDDGFLVGDISCGDKPSYPVKARLL